MDYLDKDGLVRPIMENPYYRRTAVSRSIKQNGDFSTMKRRTPMTPYVPPHRRRDSIGDCSFSSKRSEEKASSMIIQDVSRNSLIIQEINRDNSNEVFDQDDFKPRCIRKEKNISQKINRISAVERVLKLAKNYMNYEFKQALSDIYFDKYKEHLPNECLNAINFSISLELQDSINDFLNAEFHNEENNHERRFFKDKRVDKEDRPLFYQKEITKPKALELKDIGKEFWALIYDCHSFTNIKGVILDADHFEKVEELADQMKTFYQFEQLQTVNVEENGYYALFDGSWHRVQCIKCNGSTVEIFFIDRGDKDTVSDDRLFKLDPKFFKLPTQAIDMSLLDLEIFNDCEGTHEILDEMLFEKTVYVSVKNSNEEKNPALSVQLYINNDDETINVNELMAKKLFETVLNPMFHIRENYAEHVEFIHANETGLFIQFNTKSLMYFNLLMKDLSEKYHSEENFKRQKVVRFESNKTYFVRRSRENKFYRARVLQFKDENIIEVLLIDTGVVTFIDREDFFSLEKLSNVLAQYPAQALEVQLYQITVLHSKILDHLHAITSNSKELYVKFMKSEEENNNTPVIRLYKKVNGHLISINDALLVEHSDILESTPKISESKPKSAKDNFNENQPKTDECNVNENKPEVVEGNVDERKLGSTEVNFDDMFKKNFTTELERLKLYQNELAPVVEQIDCTKFSISTLLMPPTVPKGSYFDVHVTVAKDPSYFVIQLLKGKSVDLKKMMQEMNAVALNYRGPKLTYKSICVGQMYAYRCESNAENWYRVYLLKIKDKNVATVYYCDYGCYKDVSIENLRILQNQFYSLPYQAIWAELYGVKPVSGHWTAGDCSRFKDLIESKNFVCRVKNIKDVKALNRSKSVPVTVEAIYVVKLIDTSTDEDLYIADMLINEKRALRKGKNSV